MWVIDLLNNMTTLSLSLSLSLVKKLDDLFCTALYIFPIFWTLPLAVHLFLFLFCSYVCFVFEKGSCYVAQLVSKLQSFCLCLLNAEITGRHHRTQPHLMFLTLSLISFIFCKVRARPTCLTDPDSMFS
jgi:hypothetical protein